MYTRGGDKGETSLYGADRISKDSLRVEAYGTLDELNSWVGLAIAGCDRDEISRPLKGIQSELFTAGADLATITVKAPKAVPRIGKKSTDQLESMIDDLQGRLARLTTFVLPGGTETSARLHVARSVCRRAERRVVALAKKEKVNPEMVPYLNRLSTYLFNLARYANAIEGVKDEPWKK